MQSPLSTELRKAHRSLLALCPGVLGLALAGCLTIPSTDGYGGPTLDAPNTTGDDEYDRLFERLEANRTTFLGDEADELLAADNRLFWLEFRGLDPTLHGYDGASGARVDFAFPIGWGNSYNFRASEKLVVTATQGGDGIAYRAYDAAASMRLVGEISFAAPGDEQRWYAYAVDNETVYVMLVNAPGAEGDTLMRWRPGQAPTPVTTLTSAGVALGEFWDFGVEGDSMLFVESGRLWHLDLATNRAEWLGNETEVTGNVNFGRDGVLFETAMGPFFYPWDTRELVDIGQAIASAPYAITATDTWAHFYQEGLTRWGPYAIYVGQSGIFALELGTQRIFPVLLEPRSTDPSIELRYPAVITRGTAFITALTSGEADGPVYSVDLGAVLP